MSKFPSVEVEEEDNDWEEDLFADVDELESVIELFFCRCLLTKLKFE